MARGDGIAHKGHTKGKNLGDDGKTVAVDNSISGSGGKSNDEMKSLGRNRAKLANQTGSVSLKGKGF